LKLLYYLVNVYYHEIIARK